MSVVINDELYMQLAVDMAERVLGQTDVNPAVGCVIVNEGRVVGLGAHLRRGEGHAEVHALTMAGEAARGATAYVTLEPCSHYGRTPPCSLRLIESGVARVVIACVDPNPAVAGKGIALLKQHGIEVTVDVLREKGLSLIEMFAKHITTGLPFVTLKTASTLDGRIATTSGDSKWISNEQCREVVHTMRHRHQAIMVGIDTVLADDPSLTTRLSVPAVSPIRLIVDSKLRIPMEAKVVTDRSMRTCIFTTAQASEQKRRELESRGVDVVVCGEGERVDLHQMMEWCGQHDIGSILLEGGGRLNGAMLAEKLIDKIVLFIAPLVVGGQHAPANFAFEGVSRMQDAYRLQHVEIEVFGDNVCISGYPFGKRQAEQGVNKGMEEGRDDVHRAR